MIARQSTDKRLHPPFGRVARGSFTLIELLIAMAIVAILAASILFVMVGAQEQANKARARSQVTRISELLMRRWEEYRTRPMPVRIPVFKQPPAPPGTRITAGEASWVRLNALWELMRMEMPDRKSDVIDNPVFLKVSNRPSVSRAYLRRANNATMNDLTRWTEQHESAECLYLILSNMRDGDGVATDHFSPREVQDTDGDGMPEIVDPWGQPIYFLRWAPQLSSPLQDGNPANSPDPFDPYRAGVAYAMPANPPNYALFPFVYSAGPDGVHGYDHASGLQYSQTTTPPAVYMAPPATGTTWSNYPYLPASTAGTPGPASQDDIHNHFVE